MWHPFYINLQQQRLDKRVKSLNDRFAPVGTNQAINHANEATTFYKSQLVKAPFARLLSCIPFTNMFKIRCECARRFNQVHTLLDALEREPAKYVHVQIEKRPRGDSPKLPDVHASPIAKKQKVQASDEHVSPRLKR